MELFTQQLELIPQQLFSVELFSQQLELFSQWLELLPLELFFKAL